jgi:MFS family permease
MTSMLTLPSDDLWRDQSYRRLWLSILISSFGGQITSMALSLMSALMLKATPTQIGILGAMGIAPFILFSLPSGVWLDRVRKLPIYIIGEIIMTATLASVALIWSLGQISMIFLYGVAFVSGCVSVISGTAAQIVLTQIVARERLVEAHAKKGLATSSSEIAGPGAAGVLIRLIGAPLALLTNSAFLMASVLLLRGIHVVEAPANKGETYFWRNLKDGIKFVLGNRLLRSLALVVGLWQICQTTAMVVQVLFATRVLGLSEYQYGLCFSIAGIGTVVASVIGHRMSSRIGPGPCLIAGILISGIGWLQLAWAPTGAWGVVSFEAMLLSFSAGTVLIFSNMLALRQSITPPPMLARMTSTMRFMTLLPASFGTLLGGYIGEYFGLRFAIELGGLGAISLAVYVWRFSLIRNVIEIPSSRM